MVTLGQIHQLVVIASIITGFVSGLTAVAAAWAVTKWRINRLDKAVFGNGTLGLNDRVMGVEKEVIRLDEHCKMAHQGGRTK